MYDAHKGGESATSIATRYGLSQGRVSMIVGDIGGLLMRIKDGWEPEPPAEQRPPEPETTPAPLPDRKPLPTPIFDKAANKFQPWRCDQIPDRRFSITEAAEEAGVSKGAIYAAKGSRPVGPRKLTFWQEEWGGEDEESATEPAKPESSPSPVNGNGEAFDSRLSELRAALERKMEVEIKAVREKYAAEFEALERVMKLAKSV